MVNTTLKELDMSSALRMDVVVMDVVLVAAPMMPPHRSPSSHARYSDNNVGANGAHALSEALKRNAVLVSLDLRSVLPTTTRARTIN